MPRTFAVFAILLALSFATRAEAVEYRVKQFGKVKHRERPVAEWVKALRNLKVA